MMNPVLKNLWTDALRSGRYVQGREGLIKGKKHCCLAVLCRVAGAKRTGDHFVWGQKCAWEPDWEKPHISDGGLPPHLRSAAGITAKQEGKLIDFNDQKMWSFTKIADWVEKHL